MPEGPEIKRIADRLSKILAGNSLEGVYFFSQKLKKYESVLKDAKVEHVETRGKALLTHLDSGHSIYSHNQLYGRWYIVDAEKFPKTKRSLRLALKTKTHTSRIRNSNGSKSQMLLPQSGTKNRNSLGSWFGLVAIARGNTPDPIPNSAVKTLRANGTAS